MLLDDRLLELIRMVPGMTGRHLRGLPELRELGIKDRAIREALGRLQKAKKIWGRKSGSGPRAAVLLYAKKERRGSYVLEGFEPTLRKTWRVRGRQADMVEEVRLNLIAYGHAVACRKGLQTMAAQVAHAPILEDGRSLRAALAQAEGMAAVNLGVLFRQLGASGFEKGWRRFLNDGHMQIDVS